MLKAKFSLNLTLFNIPFNQLLRKAVTILTGILLFIPIAKTQAQPHAYVVLQSTSLVEKFNTVDNSSVGGVLNSYIQPVEVAITPDGALGYITNFGSDNVTVFDVASNGINGTINVGDGPWGIAITPDGTRAYVVNQNSNDVSVINIATYTVIATIEIGDEYGGASPTDVAITPDGTQAWVTNGNWGDVAVIDIATNTKITADGTIITGFGPHGIAFTPNGEQVYVVNNTGNTVKALNTADYSVYKTYSGFSSPMNVAFTPDGQFAYVTNNGNNSVAVLNHANRIQDGTINLGVNPLDVAITPNGDFAYVTHNAHNSVSMINTATNTVEDYFNTTWGNGPMGIAITPVTTVMSTSPANGTHTGAVSTDVTATFNHNINAGTVSDATMVAHTGFGGKLLSSEGAWSGSGATATLNPNSDFKPGELVQMTVTTGLTNGVATIPHVWQFRSTVSQGWGTFYDSGFTQSDPAYDVAMGDLDGDGHLDAFLAIYAGANKVCINDGSGNFSEKAQTPTLGTYNSVSVALGDVDGDGDLDAFVTNHVHGSRVWINDGSANFSDSGNDLGAPDQSYDGALGDLDGDGDLDAFIVNGFSEANKVWKNDGSGNFSDTGQTIGNSSSSGVALGDLDGDGDLDAYVTNNGADNKVWINDGSLNFSEKVQSPVLGSATSQEVALGDVDGDGDLDAFVANNGVANKVWSNDGTASFSDSGNNLIGLQSFGVTLGDVDGDGDLDAFVVNNGADEVWTNNGSGIFSDSGNSLEDDYGQNVALGDVDGDGDLDAFVANLAAANRVWFNQKLDFGDLPTAYNNTVLAVDDGARHEKPYTGAIILGTVWDDEADGQESSDAGRGGTDGDDYSGVIPAAYGFDSDENTADGGVSKPAMASDDEDGVTVVGSWQEGINGGSVQVVVTGGSGYLSAWIDWNGNNSFADAGDQIFNMLAVSAGTQTLTFDIPVGAIPSSTTYNKFSRFRLDDSNASAMTTTGLVTNGEVEDHYLQFTGQEVTFVTDTSPANATHSGAVSTDVNAIFNKNINVGTVSDATLVAHAGFGGKLLSSEGSWSGTGTTATLNPNSDFKPGELVQMTVTNGLTNGGPTQPHVWQFRSNVSRGVGTFFDTDQSLESNSSWCAALGDVDGDGDLDAFVANDDNTANRVFVNQGGAQSGSEGEYQAGQSLGNYTSQSVALGDLDNDGDLDAFVANYNQGNRVWVNQGGDQGGTEGDFQDSNQSLGNASSYCVALGDIDGDGDLDAFVANIIGANKVWMNDGSGTFTDSGQTLGNYYSGDVALGDLDDDGDLDAFVANLNAANRVYWNDGDGVFSDSGQTLGSYYSQGVSLGDVDGDGDLDAFVANENSQTNRVWVNNGSGYFSEKVQTPSLGTLTSKSVSLGDVDGDGDLDAFVANLNAANRVWLNAGDGNFSDSGQPLGSYASNSIALGDLDSDGDLDAFVANDIQTNRVWLNQKIDFGDLPTAFNNTVLATDDGARHEIPYSGAINLGTNIDNETDGQEDSDAGATGGGDDFNGTPDDEDGVTVTATPWKDIPGGGSVQVVVTGGSGYLSAWIDWNGNNSFADTGDQIFYMEAVSAGSNTLTFNIPGGTFPSSTTYNKFARFRLDDSNASAMTTTGLVTNGEVEDHYLQFTGEPAVAVINVTPANAIHSAAVSTDVTATFNKNINVGTVSDATLVAHTGFGGKLISTEGAWSGANNTATLNPNTDFKPGELVQMTVTSGLTNGGSTQPYVWQFRTAVTRGWGTFGPQQIISTSANSAYTVHAADMDGDGDLDALSASSTDHKIAWYENDGSGGTWSPTTVTTTTINPESAIAVDIDGDGDMDVLTASYTDNKIAWFENDGSGGTWSPTTITTAANGAEFVYAADMDGDGDMDALSASASDDKIAWYENDGSGGTWTPTEITTSADGARSVYAADIDSDGDLDVLSASESDDKIAWYENDGSGGTWTPTEITTSADGARCVYAADLDGDGDLDVLSASYEDDKIAWYENDGSGGTWTPTEITTTADGANSVYAADMDGDGDLDALSSSFGFNRISWFENDGSGGTWTPTVITIEANRAEDVFAADMDGDGDLDVLSASMADDKIAWYENWGVDMGDLPPPYNNTTLGTDDGARHDIPYTGAIHLGTSIDNEIDGQESNDAGRAATTGDDGDGTDDEDGVTVTATPWEDTPDGGSVQVVVTGGSGYLSGWIDWNGDNDFVDTGEQIFNMEAVTAGTNTLTFDIPGGTFASSTTYNRFARFRLDDTNTSAMTTQGLVTNGEVEDHYLQFTAGPVVGVISTTPANATHSGAVSTDVTATFNKNINVGTVSDATLVAHTRFGGKLLSSEGSWSGSGATATLNPNIDFKPGELVQMTVTSGLQNGGPTQPHVWQFRSTVSRGWGSFFDNGQSLGSSESQAVSLGDVDGDGDLDAFVVNKNQSNKVWLNDGGVQGGTPGNFTENVQTPALGSSDSRDVALGDVDGDGDLDAFVVNSGQANKVWENDGSGNFTEKVQTPTLGSSDSRGVFLGDLDGDGDLDAFVANSGQANKVWENDGSGNFTEKVQTPALGSSQSFSISLGDVDGDGDLDAFVANYAEPNKVWENDGSGNFTEKVQTPTLGTFFSQTVSLGDVDNDGDLDAFVGNYAQGNRVWENDGSGNFTDSGNNLGSAVSYCVSLGDVDGDGDLDAFVANWSENKVWENDGGVQGGTLGNFTDSGQILGGSGNFGSSLGDLDGDGDLDAFVAIWNNANEVLLNQSMDFGDLPAAYNNTVLGTDNGARHEKLYNGVITLGTEWDNETDGQESANADGDDTTGTPDDEDGVSVYGIWHDGTHGGAVTVVVTGGTGYLSGWIDWNGNNSFGDSGDQVFDMQSLTAGTHKLLFDIPAGTIPAYNTYNKFARFRLDDTNTSAMTTKGLVTNGEVEDYYFSFTGDLDSDGDGIVDTNEGGPDRDNDGVANLADYDPAGWIYDENTGEIITGGTISVAPSTGVTIAQNGSTGYYQFFVSIAGTYTLTYTPPASYQLSTSRTAQAGPLDPTGQPHPYAVGMGSKNGATNYLTDWSEANNPFYLTFDLALTDPWVINNNIPVLSLDFGDAPDPLDGTAGQYPTLLANNGPRHAIIPELRLGTLADVDSDGQPAPAADGDDNDGTDDDDGVTNLSQLVLYKGVATEFDLALVNTTGSTATIKGWIDYNRNGIFEASESATTTAANGATKAQLTFPIVPQTAAGATYARFRIATNAAEIADPTGMASDGEVEDYPVSIGGVQVVLMKPVGDEWFRGGASQRIEWYTIPPGVGSIDLYCSFDGGQNYHDVIATGLPNIGFHVWEVPATNNQFCRVKIDVIGSLLASGHSARNFTIDSTPPNVALTYPTGSATWMAGGTYTITWSPATDNYRLADKPIEIHYSLDDWATYTVIAADLSNTGAYDWTVPNSLAGATNLQVKVRSVDYVGNVYCGHHGGTISVQGTPVPLQLTGPNGGETFAAGSSQKITWSSNVPSGKIDLYYSMDGGDTYPNEIAKDEINDGSFDWIVPDINTQSLRIKAVLSGPVDQEDVSDLDLTVDALAPTVELTSPNTGLTIEAGGSVEVTWTAQDNFGLLEKPISLFYSTDGGATFPNAIVQSEENDGKYTWNVPTDLNSSKVRLRVEAVDKAGLKSTSTSKQDMTIAPLTLALTYPNGGEVFAGGETKTITWASTLDEGRVTLRYTTDGGKTWPHTIAANEDNDGTFDWTLPGLNSQNVSVKITLQSAQVHEDQTNGAFTIDSTPPSIILQTFTGGDSVEAGGKYEIQWKAEDNFGLKENSIVLKYSDDGGLTYPHTIAENLENKSTYTWTTPKHLYTDKVRLKIETTDEAGLENSNVSPSSFTVMPLIINITQPNGGELWNGMTLQTIKWNSNFNSGFVTLRYSTNGGQTWPHTIASGLENSLRKYDWEVPQINAENVKVKAELSLQNQTFDVSNNGFQIQHHAPVVTIIYPIGGETWEANSTNEIRWTAEDSHFDLKDNPISILFSKDGGKTFNDSIAVKIKNDSLLYWTTPRDLNSSEVRIKVEAENVREVMGYDVIDEDMAVLNPPPVITSIPDVSFENTGAAYFDLDPYVSDNNDRLIDLVWTGFCAEPKIEIIINNENKWCTIIAREITGLFDVILTATDPWGDAASDTIQVDVTGPTAVETATIQAGPTEYVLHQNFPNPFNPQTTLTYGLPEDGEIQILVFDMSGRQVAELYNGHQSKGYHTVIWHALDQPSGVYFIRMMAKDFHDMKKCILMK